MSRTPQLTFGKDYKLTQYFAELSMPEVLDKKLYICLDTLSNERSCTLWKYLESIQSAEEIYYGSFIFSSENM